MLDSDREAAQLETGNEVARRAARGGKGAVAEARDRALGAEVALRQAVEERSRHDSLDDVTDTLERWSIEQLLRKEYHGRFLFELVQNAVDAFSRQYPDRRDGRLLIWKRGSRVVVANEGEYLTPDVVILSLSKVGQSTKSEGTSIGHKGIGFKSVLEVTLTPRIYSREDPNGDFTLRVHYDPESARAAVEAGTMVEKGTSGPSWVAAVQDAAGRLGVEPEPDHVPILRFPFWDDESPTWLEEVGSLAGGAFNTMVVLEHDRRFDDRLGIDDGEWEKKVRLAAGDLSDEVVLLLGSLGTIVLDGVSETTPTTIERRSHRSARLAGPEFTEVVEVSVVQNGTETSRWLRFGRKVQGRGDAEGEIVVAIRVLADTRGRLVPILPTGAPLGSSDSARVPHAGDCFHLFFPTEIRSGLPFLLHAYFKVDSGRTKFARDAEPRNKALLGALRELTVDTVRWVVADPDGWGVDGRGLADLFGATADGVAGEGADQLARSFRDQLLTELDEVSWIPAVGERGDLVMAKPKSVMVDGRGRIDELLREAFEPSYPARLGVGYLPHPAVGRSGLAYLAARRTRADLRPEGFLSSLLRPGATEPWALDPAAMDAGFAGLVRLLDHWSSIDPAAAIGLISSLAGDEAAALVPVLSPDGGRVRRYPPKVEPGRTIEGGLVFARPKGATDTSPPPPEGLRVSFLQDHLLTADETAGAANQLGVRRFETDAVLSAIVAEIQAPESKVPPSELAGFAWSVLLAAPDSSFSVQAALDQLDRFEPGQWAWFRRAQTTTDDEIGRARGLAGLLLPAQDGKPRPAGELAFGTAWADWLESHSIVRAGSAVADRIAAYRDLETIKPSAASIVAGPDELTTLFPAPAGPLPPGSGGEESAPPIEDTATRHARLIHAFLLRIGVWEVPPIAAIVDRTTRGAADRDPWQELPNRDLHRAAVDDADREFARSHTAIHVGRDFRLLWAPDSRPPMLRSLDRAVELLKACSRIRLFCSACGRHKQPLWVGDVPEALSYLAFSLRTLPWIDVRREGETLPDPVRPSKAWFEPDAPPMPGLLQSPMRFLPLAPRALSPVLASYLGIEPLESASPSRIEALLVDLSMEFEGRVEAGEIRVGTELGRTLVGLHRRCYQRLYRADPASAGLIAARTGVLTSSGPELRWRRPGGARHDDGRHSVFKGLFSRGDVWFVVLKQDQKEVATALGVDPFEVKVDRRFEGEPDEVTSEVRPFVHDLAPEFLALRTFHPIGGQTLELDSIGFREASRHLEALRVFRVDDLILDIALPPNGAARPIGENSHQDIYVDNTNPAAPEMYHDMPIADWQGRLQKAIGPHIANLLGSDAYAATFQLLLMQTDRQRPRFLRDLGIGDDEMSQVRASIGRSTAQARAEGERWRLALVSALRLRVTPTARDDEWAAAIIAAMGPSGDTVVRAGQGSTVRADERPDGALASLAQAGVSLAALHASLQRLDATDGLWINVAGKRLTEWRRLHGREVVVVLARTPGYAGDPVSRPDAWRLPEQLRFELAPRTEDWLAPVASDLESAGLAPDVLRLGDADGCSDYLAELARIERGDFAKVYAGLIDETARTNLVAEHLAHWRKALRASIVALRTSPGDPGFAIRETGEAVDTELAGLPAVQEDFAGRLALLLGDHPAVAEQYSALVRRSDPVSYPPLSAIERVTLEVVDKDHLRRVESELNRVANKVAEDVRRTIRELRAAHVTPRPFSGVRPIVDPGSVVGDLQSVTHPPRRHNDEAKDRVGRAAEAIVVASVIDQVLGLDTIGRSTAIRVMADALRKAFKGKVVAEVEAAATAAADPDLDEDGLIVALESFVHVSKRSDQFGFDVIGFLAPYESNPAPEALFLEVKSVRPSSDGTRSFPVSATEWKVAGRPKVAHRYCFCLVVRADGTTNTSIELLPNPTSLERPRELQLHTETWQVSFAPKTPERSEPPPGSQP